jgi:hypothetical protein
MKNKVFSYRADCYSIVPLFIFFNLEIFPMYQQTSQKSNYTLLSLGLKVNDILHLCFSAATEKIGKLA